MTVAETLAAWTS